MTNFCGFLNKPSVYDRYKYIQYNLIFMSIEYMNQYFFITFNEILKWNLPAAEEFFSSERINALK